jgi:RecJ-like exonuclease
MKTKTCPDCNGDGVLDKGMDDEHQCPTCGGCGFVPDDDDDEDVLNASPKADMCSASSDVGFVPISDIRHRGRE